MILLPIDIDETKNSQFSENRDCMPVLEAYPGFYRKAGYNKPWIGYFASSDGQEIVGTGGFKGKPKDGRVEIAYMTFERYERQGIGTEICRQLVLLSRFTDPSVRITARTLQNGHASMGILQKNGFECMGIVHDADDGEVLEWEWKSATPDIRASATG